jgi:hypothetical protein
MSGILPMRQPNQLKELETCYVLRNFFRISPTLLILACIWLWYAEPAYGQEVIDVTPAPLQEQEQQHPRLDETQLQQIVGPIALYSDDLLALVLGAAAHPVQAISAARRVTQQNNSATAIDYDPDWHPSVVALTHYPQALQRFDQDLQWTQQLHEAVRWQNKELLNAIQTFRRNAHKGQALYSSEHVVVEDDGSFIRIRQRHPELIYVPDYQPRNVVVVRSEPTHKIIHRTWYQPIVYRSYNRFDPYYHPRAVHDPFWYDPFWNDPLWGVNSHGFLTWRDRHTPRPRAIRKAKRWWHKPRKRAHSPRASHTVASTPKAKYRRRTDPNNEPSHRQPRKHHSVNAFNQPMFENNRGLSPRTVRPKTQPSTPKRATRHNSQNNGQRRYNSDAKPIMNNRQPARASGPIR